MPEEVPELPDLTDSLLLSESTMVESSLCRTESLSTCLGRV